MANTLNLGNGNWATKEDSLLAYNSENGNFKPLAFNFTRASSATVVNKAGLIETVGSGEARIDYKDDSKGALKLEPTRSNLVTYSEDFSQWSSGGTPTVVLSSSLAPNGSLDAYDITDDSTGVYEIKRSNSALFNGTYTMSIFVKKTTGALTHYPGIQFIGLSDYLIINTTNGTVNQTASEYSNIKVEDFSNWWKISATGTNTDSTFLINVWAAISSNGTSLSSFTTGTNTFYGAQLEQGSYATSYIPTQGSAVTRVAESCSQTVPSGIIGQTEGTVFLDVDFKTLSGTNMFVSIRPDASNKIEIYRTDAAIYGEFASDASFNFNKPSVTVGRYKIAVAYSSGSSAMYINGVLIGSNTTPFAFTSTLDGIYINSRGTTFIEQSSYNDVKLYNTRLSNAELQALTSN